MTGMFYILSIAKTRTSGVPTWWLQSQHGYTKDLRHAGKWSLEAIATEEGRFDNGTSTRAMSCSLVDDLVSVNVPFRDVAFALEEADTKVEGLKREGERATNE